jgi:hypothetical protein
LTILATPLNFFFALHSIAVLGQKGNYVADLFSKAAKATAVKKALGT